jgi:hypothetical protein
VINLSYVQQYEDPRNSPEARALRNCKDKIVGIRSFLLYEKDLRTLAKTDIDMCERDLRDILREVEKFRYGPNTINFISSVDEVQTNVKGAINCLYLASDVLEQGHTARGRKLFYQTLGDCEQFLLEAIRLFFV